MHATSLSNPLLEKILSTNASPKVLAPPWVCVVVGCCWRGVKGWVGGARKPWHVGMPVGLGARGPANSISLGVLDVRMCSHRSAPMLVLALRSQV